jgi:hypothetical protein
MSQGHSHSKSTYNITVEAESLTIPTQCTDLFQPTPRPGRHPCLGPPESTPAPEGPTTATELSLSTVITIPGTSAGPTAVPISTELILTTVITISGPAAEPATTSDLVLTTVYPTETVVVEGPEETITVTAEEPSTDRETITVGAPGETSIPAAPGTERETITA